MSRLTKISAKVYDHHKRGYRHIAVGALPIPIHSVIRIDKYLGSIYRTEEILGSVRGLSE